MKRYDESKDPEHERWAGGSRETPATLGDGMTPSQRASDTSFTSLAPPFEVDILTRRPPPKPQAGELAEEDFQRELAEFSRILSEYPPSASQEYMNPTDVSRQVFIKAIDKFPAWADRCSSAQHARLSSVYPIVSNLIERTVQRRFTSLDSKYSMWTSYIEDFMTRLEVEQCSNLRIALSQVLEDVISMDGPMGDAMSGGSRPLTVWKPVIVDSQCLSLLRELEEYVSRARVSGELSQISRQSPDRK